MLPCSLLLLYKIAFLPFGELPVSSLPAPPYSFISESIVIVTRAIDCDVDQPISTPSNRIVSTDPLPANGTKTNTRVVPVCRHVELTTIVYNVRVFNECHTVFELDCPLEFDHARDQPLLVSLVFLSPKCRLCLSSFACQRHLNNVRVLVVNYCRYVDSNIVVYRDRCRWPKVILKGKNYYESGKNKRRVSGSLSAARAY